jgi:steroid delta-isomerase-like uncharacterized protein
MIATDPVQRYFDAWNQRDGDAVAACFAEGGTYEDPASGGRLQGKAIADFVARTVEMLPDLQFEVVSEQRWEGGAAAQWLMKGTNTGPLPGGAPPSGREIAVPGSDFIEVGAGGIRSLRGYFDRQEMYEQLGLDVIVQPEEIWPVKLGTGVYIPTGRTAEPRALGFTILRIRSAEEQQRVRDDSTKIIMELFGNESFLGFGSFGTKHAMTTVTMWTDPDEAHSALLGGEHKRVMREFYQAADYTDGGMTSLWTLAGIQQSVRCPQGHMVKLLPESKPECPRCHSPVERQAYF